MSEVKYRSRDWLENEMQNKTLTEIAEECGVTTACISKWKRKFDLGSNKMIACPACDKQFISIGNHWNYNPNHRPEISQKQKEIITGVLMGDGCINREERKKPRLQVYMTNKKYLNYLSKEFGIFSTGVYDHVSNEDRKNLAPGSVNNENYSDVYRFETRGHLAFEEFADWYSSGEKVFPEDIKLTPTVLKHWYVCDGTIDHGRANPNIVIACGNEIDFKDKLQNIFQDSGFQVSNFLCQERGGGASGVSMTLQFTVDMSKEMFEYMGEPLPGFEYKWP